MNYTNYEESFRKFHKEEQKNLATRYIGTSALMIIIWYVSGRGYFWPAWVIASFMISILAREANKRLIKRKNAYQQRDR